MSERRSNGKSTEVVDRINPRAPLPTQTIQEVCEDCGVTFDRSPGRRRRRCDRCANDRVITNAVELKKKSGPAYDRWREAMRKAASEV